LVLRDGQDGTPVTGPGAGSPGGTAERRHVVTVEPQAAEGSDGVAGHGEPSTDLAELGTALEDGDVPAGADEADRRREPGDPGADHHCRAPARVVAAHSLIPLRVAASCHPAMACHSDDLRHGMLTQ